MIPAVDPAPPTIVIDARMVGPVPDGISRYVALLARGLAALHETAPVGLPYRVVFLVRPGYGVAFPASLAPFETHAVAAPFLSASELVAIPRALRALVRQSPGPVAYHSPSFSSLRGCPVPWLVTVHDLIHLRFGDARRRLYYRWLLRPFVRGATARLTVSAYSRANIARWAGLPESAIELVRTALDPAFVAPPAAEDLAAALAARGLRAGEYFFCLSNPKPHKNVAMLVAAYRAFRERTPRTAGEPWPLVLNVPGFDDVPGVRRVEAPARDELRCLLGGAGAFLFPSRDEGFGLPPVEAAMLGAPVVVSRIPPIVEAMAPFGERGVRWVDPDDLAGWTHALADVAGGDRVAPDPAGRARALEILRPERLGADVDRLYRSVLGVREPQPEGTGRR